MQELFDVNNRPRLSPIKKFEISRKDEKNVVESSSSSSSEEEKLTRRRLGQIYPRTLERLQVVIHIREGAQSVAEVSAKVVAYDLE